MKMALLNRWFGWRYVLLTNSLGTKIVRAHRTEAGWIASYFGSSDTWHVLEPSGKVRTNEFMSWLPCFGWTDGYYQSDEQTLNPVAVGIGVDNSRTETGTPQQSAFGSDGSTSGTDGG